jgi:hypothetical protein
MVQGRQLLNAAHPPMTMRLLPVFLTALFLAGCATKSTVQTRKQERSVAYTALSEEQKSLVEQGKIKAGMGEDAVYIAWGKPDQVLHSGDAAGESTTWLYHGTTTDEYVYWNSYPMSGRRGGTFDQTYLDRVYDFRDYVRAELIFRNGRLENWRMLPKPGDRTIFAP